MSSQAPFSNYHSETKLSGSVPKANQLLNWYQIRPALRRFILLNVVRVIDENKAPSFNLLVSELSHNMGDIVKEMIQIYAGNLLHYGLLEYCSKDKLKFTDKIWDDLQTATEALMESRG